MADPDATLRGILERNEAAAATGGETAAYHLNHVTIELDTSEVGTLEAGLEGLPVSVEGSFETREHPELGTRWVFKAHSARSESFSGRGGSQTTPPPGGSRSAT